MYYVCGLRDQEYLYIYIHVYHWVIPCCHHWLLVKEQWFTLRDPVTNLNLVIIAAERVNQ